MHTIGAVGYMNLNPGRRNLKAGEVLEEHEQDNQHDDYQSHKGGDHGGASLRL